MSLQSITTERFGTVQVEASQILHFEGSILGFEHLKQFALIQHQADSPFQWLQALEDPALAFVVTHPGLFGFDYSVTIPEPVARELAIEQADDLIILTIVTIPDDNPAQMTANLLAPLVIHRKSQQARQVILDDPAFSTRVRLLPDTALATAPAGAGEEG